ncbi:Pimeloyl-ACP methyl ester carboxylesterase [Prauserella flava]|uniref:Alpha/beta fold hydrolase n=2 Tax=Prauserella TaxID=142577 RepID=A0ABW6G6K4_9PSEU|nr:Pimeloyl-ACP methyl ester carboxylesterase [Prauserella flava]MCR3737150.1 Pimeloyl-ACP methyl ester carboxylesterase [Prauserella salsuginis]
MLDVVFETASSTSAPIPQHRQRPAVRPADTRRGPLTHVPLSRASLPAYDPMLPPWEGSWEAIGGGDDRGQDGARLHVRRTPGLPDRTAVYVHGLGGSSTNWTDLAAQLAPQAEGIALDLPGFGFSEPPRGFPYSLDAHADVVARYLESLGRPVDLFGNSMGGAVSLLLAARRPELVRTLTLVSPAMPDRRPDPRRLSDPRMALAMLPVIGTPARRQLARLTPEERALQTIRLVYADADRFPRHRLTEQAEEFAARSKYAWAGAALARSTLEIFRSWFTPGPGSLWSAAPQVQVPTLVVWGTEDRVISVRRARRTADAIPSARLLVLPRTGHVAQMERPVTVARAVLGMWEHLTDGRW